MIDASRLMKSPQITASRVATRYDRCAHTFFSAISIAA